MKRRGFLGLIGLSAAAPVIAEATKHVAETEKAIEKVALYTSQPAPKGGHVAICTAGSEYSYADLQNIWKGDETELAANIERNNALLARLSRAD